MAQPDPVAAFISRWSQAEAAECAQQFARANAKDVQAILETLAALGRAHEGDTKGTFVR